jgi:hypothetical protein
MTMNLQKNAAEKALKFAPISKYSAVRIDKNATSSDKTTLLKEVIRDIEKITKSQQSVTLILVTD